MTPAMILSWLFGIVLIHEIGFDQLFNFWLKNKISFSDFFNSLSFLSWIIT